MSGPPEQYFLSNIIEIVVGAIAFVPPLVIGVWLIIRYIKYENRKGKWIDAVLGVLNLVSIIWLLAYWLILGLVLIFNVEPLIPD